MHDHIGLGPEGQAPGWTRVGGILWADAAR